MGPTDAPLAGARPPDASASTRLCLPGTSCIQCGYDLGGTRLDGVCPECGRPAAHSCTPHPLADLGSAYLGQVASGLRLVLNAILLRVLMGIVAGVVGAVAGGGTFAYPTLYMLVMIVLVLIGYGAVTMYLVGWIRATRVSPRDPIADRSLNTRRLLRIGVWANLILTVVEGVLNLLNMVMVQTPAWGQAGQPNPAGAGLSISLFMVVGVSLLVIGLLSLAVLGVVFFSSMFLVRDLAFRIPDRRAYDLAKSRLISIPLWSTVGILALGLGPLIGLILYWNLLNRVAKGIKALAGRLGPASAALPYGPEPV